MADHLVVVESLSDWKPEFPALPVVAAKDYLADAEVHGGRALRVLNLCRSYRYLSTGYYCSLLAEARHHRVIPSVRTINDLSRKAIYEVDIEDLDAQVDTILGRPQPGFAATAFELEVFFGQCPMPALQDLAGSLFDAFRAPLLKVEFRLQGRWRIHAIKAMALNALAPVQADAFVAALQTYLSKRWRHQPKSRTRYRYDLAILHNPAERLPPSDGPALQRFIKAGRALGVNCELIQRKDYSRLAEFDALFIRETTGISHYTYQFAKKAESEGLVVIDDPDSILKCTNKVYLEELLRTRRVRTPRTVIVRRDSLDKLESRLDYPMVLKIPDGSFSRGVFKVESRAELMEQAGRLFKSSDLILAQEFLYTPFDWRVGIIDRTPIYVCQYFMSRQHWQIVSYDERGEPDEGGFKTWAVEDAPPMVVKIALKAANLIGDGLYGVDLKETPRGGVRVIEVNDNPSIDGDVEDAVVGEALYQRIMETFVSRLDRLRGL